MLRWIVIGILILTMLAVAASVQAQTAAPAGPAAPPTSTTPGTSTPPAPTAGTFESLSPGGQKIARALFEAQKTTTTAPKPLTLDEIAARKQAGTGWGRVFKDMKAQGLVQEKNLGQVVSRYQHQHRPHAGRGAVTTASGRESHEPRGWAKQHGDDDDRTEHGRRESGWKGEHGRAQRTQSYAGGSTGGPSSGRSGAGVSEHGRVGGGHGGGRGK
ncbi:MAG: hypothetical protein HYV94_09680 [Candidatus Rokubacteria bacterium]|nr:hypothetical protein [Candidatus Rokubacteria bacterium]